MLMGGTRAGQERALPLLAHGDAAFAGRAIAAEMLDMDGLAGSGVRGTGASPVRGSPSDLEYLVSKPHAGRRRQPLRRETGSLTT